jgi:arabinogalactan oligomer / maltooligosaccharide transport system permease protein
MSTSSSGETALPGTPAAGATLGEGLIRADEEIGATRIPRPAKPPFREVWWRYLVALVAIAFAVFPAIYIVSASLDPIPSLAASSLIPSGVTLDNYRTILSSEEEPYLKWYATTMGIAIVSAVFTVLLAALAAYAFARFRFKGRRMGMLSLLLIQMFPQFLAIVAIYLIMLEVSDIFPMIGLNTRSGVILVYLGGALGINAWLMKGFFDSIPNELDESARVDGATPAQVFWGIILPLAAPVLAVIGLLSFISTINEYVIVSQLLQDPQKYTLSVGLFNFVNREYGQDWGPFCAGVALMAIPVILLFLFLQRFIVQGLTGGVKG